LPDSGAELLLLDIQMPGMGGLEVARHLTSLTEAPTVVFVTAHERHAVDAFELNALDYLLKPVRAERLAGGAEESDRSRPRAAGEGCPDSARVHLRLGAQSHRAGAGARDHFPARRAEIRHPAHAQPRAPDRRASGVPGAGVRCELRAHPSQLPRVARSDRGFERGADGDDEPHWVVVLDGLEEKLPVSRRQWPALRELVAEK
jgi:two-component system response regulator AlgR